MHFGILVALALTVAPLEAAKPILQNEQVAVWDGTWAEGQRNAPWDKDTVLIFLSEGTLQAVAADAGASAVFHKVGDVEFVPKGMGSQRQGASKLPVRAIIIRLEGASPPALVNTAGVRDAFDRPGIEKAFSNDEVTAWRYTWEFGKRTPLHFHARDVVVVYLSDGVLKSITPDGKSVLNPNSFGFTKFSPRGRVHFEELVEGKASAVMVELY